MAAVGPRRFESSDVTKTLHFMPSIKVDLTSTDKDALQQVTEFTIEGQMALASARGPDDGINVIKDILPKIIKAEVQVKGLAEHFFRLITGDIKLLLVFCNAMLLWKEIGIETKAQEFFKTYTETSMADGSWEQNACLSIAVGLQGGTLPRSETTLFEEGVKKTDRSVN